MLVLFHLSACYLCYINGLLRLDVSQSQVQCRWCGRVCAALTRLSLSLMQLQTEVDFYWCEYYGSFLTKREQYEENKAESQVVCNPLHAC